MLAIILFHFIGESVLPTTVSWVHNCGEHHGCLSEVDVWFSDGSDTQNTDGEQRKKIWGKKKINRMIGGPH